MNENFTNTELLIKYLDGELDGAEQNAVKKSIEENTSTSQEFENLRLAKEAVKLHCLQKKVGSIHSEMMQELKQETTQHKPAVVRKLIRYSMRIAAAFIILIGMSVLYQYFTASPEKLFNENFEAFSLHETRGDASGSLNKSYQQENMQAVIQQFNLLKAPETTDYFLAGNAYLTTGQPDKAIQAFAALQQKNKTDNTYYFEEDTEYYMALALLANKQTVIAIPLFEKIHADKAHPYNKKIGSWFLTKLRKSASGK